MDKLAQEEVEGDYGQVIIYGLFFVTPSQTLLMGEVLFHFIFSLSTLNYLSRASTRKAEIPKEGRLTSCPCLYVSYP
jgi:hypothetical protein